MSTGVSAAFQGFQLCVLILGCGAGSNILAPLDLSVFSYSAGYF